MKYFVIEVTYTVPIANIDANLKSHRDFLQTGYDQNLLLMSGSQNPRIGGMIIARARSREEIQAFFADDPFQRLSLAEYRFIEFSPLKHAKLVEPWIELEN